MSEKNNQELKIKASKEKEYKLSKLLLDLNDLIDGDNLFYEESNPNGNLEFYELNPWGDNHNGHPVFILNPDGKIIHADFIPLIIDLKNSGQQIFIDIDYEKIRKEEAEKYKKENELSERIGKQFILELEKQGLTQEEIKLLERWHYFMYRIGNTIEEACEYAKRLAKKIIAYRDVKIEDIESGTYNINSQQCPWYSPSESFYDIDIKHVKYNLTSGGVLRCLYDNKKYYFNIGKPEREITEDMFINGKWSVLTFDD